ncbi:hypothetical protein GW17_00053825 [Ensete ventricosum]|nr:hypothetical protein GW17_00053825 [Ensete ventricosum]
MQWELAGSSLGVYQRNWEAHQEHVGRLPEVDHKTHRKNAGGYWIDGIFKVLPSQDSLIDPSSTLVVTSK